MNFLIEEFRPDKKLTLYESGGGFNVRFKFAESDTENLNKRVYPHKVLSAAIGAAQKKIDEGASLYGSCDHKAAMGIDDISHRLLSVTMRGNDALAEAAILKTAKGSNLIQIIRGGGSVGASMRGMGSVTTVEGKGVVGSDYQLHGVDIVLNPSFNTSISAANIFESASFDGLERLAGDERVVRALFENAIKSGFKGSYLDFRTSYYLRRK